MITWEQVVAGVSFVGCLIAIFKAMGDSRRANRKEIEDKTAERTEMRSNMTHIREGVDEIKETQAVQLKESRDLCDRVTRVEGTAAEALRRIVEHERRGAQ